MDARLANSSAVPSCKHQKVSSQSLIVLLLFLAGRVGLELNWNVPVPINKISTHVMELVRC